MRDSNLTERPQLGCPCMIVALTLKIMQISTDSRSRCAACWRELPSEVEVEGVGTSL